MFFCLEILEHLEDPYAVLEEIKRVLKKDGRVFIMIPIENHILFRVIWSAWKMWKGRIWNNTHIQEYTSQDIIQMLESKQLKVTHNHRFLLGMLQLIVAEKL